MKTKDLRRIAEVVNISQLEIERTQVSNRRSKITVRRDGEMLGYLSYEAYEEKEIIIINIIEIYEQYRQNGLAMLLYREFSEIYNSEYPNWRISRKFINPIAEYTYNKAVMEGLFPESTLDNARREYNEQDEELWNNELAPKLKDLRKNQ